jgi:hypothetical protein
MVLSGKSSLEVFRWVMSDDKKAEESENHYVLVSELNKKKKKLREMAEANK